MIKRYFYLLAGILLLLGTYWLTLLPILAIRTNLETKYFGVALAIWGLLAALFFLPALAVIIKNVWFFKGKGEPVVLDLLQSILLGVNELEAPVTVRKHGKKLVVSWRCSEPQWCELIEKSGMHRLYELWLRFDNNTKTVSMTDRYRSVNWDLSPITVKTGRFSFSKPFFKIALGREWGVENYEDTPSQEYTYSQNEIKSPVLNSILRNGWNVRFTLF